MLKQLATFAGGAIVSKMLAQPAEALAKTGCEKACATESQTCIEGKYFVRIEGYTDQVLIQNGRESEDFSLSLIPEGTNPLRYQGSLEVVGVEEIVNHFKTKGGTDATFVTMTDPNGGQLHWVFLGRRLSKNDIVVHSSSVLR